MASPPPDPVTPAPTTGRVLLVDDEPGLLRGFSRALESAGFQVETTSDGRDALARIAATEFDVVVSDLSMPGLDGIELLKAVRERDLDVPVVLVTANPDIESASRAIELGVLRYLIKPVEMEHLVRVVGEALHMHRLACLKREALEYLDKTGKWIGDKAGLVVRFENALKTLWMAYQPIVSWSQKAVFGYEALVRPTEPTLPHPGALLDAADRLGRQQDLGRLLRNVVANTIAQSLEVESVFVNVHAYDLADEWLYDPQAPLSRIAKRVFLEITERAALEDVKDLRQRIERLRKVGFRIAVDDLGAGYAGLTSFAQLEPDLVKIDMTLIRNVHEEPTKRRLIRSIVSLCAEMNILVVCEGVETRQEREALTQIGCDLLQGYLFARPGKPFPVPGSFD